MHFWNPGSGNEQECITLCRMGAGTRWGSCIQGEEKGQRVGGVGKGRGRGWERAASYFTPPSRSHLTPFPTCSLLLHLEHTYGALTQRQAARTHTRNHTRTHSLGTRLSLPPSLLAWRTLYTRSPYPVCTAPTRWRGGPPLRSLIRLDAVLSDLGTVLLMIGSLVRNAAGAWAGTFLRLGDGFSWSSAPPLPF